MALQPWRTGIVTRIQDETYNTKRFWIQVPELETFDFIPGQFVTLDLPIHEKPNKRWRSYSIASPPDGSNTFEL
jgi:CDP-4-dehydro-6-deoxyglucose reductase